MESYRKYGSAPFKVSLIHGGPGAPGYMKSVACELSIVCGVIEPLQSAKTIDGQVVELKNILKINCLLPVTLIGHSWGAWLSIIFASENPEYVKKIILISSGPFDDEYSHMINETRLKRLSEKDIVELNKLKLELNNYTNTNKKEIFKKFGELSSKADYFKPINFNDDILDYQPDIFQTVMREALYLRKNGKLLKLAGRINCPVIAIHGDYDPHPYKGVEEPLSKIVKDFRLILLNDCGHYPWNEVKAKEKFYEIIKKEL
ncbi:MAG: alpha/beta hydrolase [Ignavibacteriae bacterium]|nr:alpha/beta hydrolase [Ignavibacteriota bacterium]